jgi:hypothetical protein
VCFTGLLGCWDESSVAVMAGARYVKLCSAWGRAQQFGYEPSMAGITISENLVPCRRIAEHKLRMAQAMHAEVDS